MAKSKKHPAVHVTVAKFDAEQHYTNNASAFRMRFSAVRDGVEISEFKDVGGGDYAPAGMTPLLDATAAFIHKLENAKAKDRVVIGLLLDESGSMGGNVTAVIDSTNEFVHSLPTGKKVDPEVANTVMAVILTDGLENASEEHDAESVKKLIKAKEEDGWTFIYMGANQDAWNVARKSGYSGGVTGQSVNYTSSPAGTRSAMRDASVHARSYVSDHVAYAAMAAAAPMRTIAEDEPDGEKPEPWRESAEQASSILSSDE